MNTGSEKANFKKILGHIGATFLILTAIAIPIDLLHKNILLGIIGLVIIPYLAGKLLARLGYNVKASPLFRETRFVTIAKYLLLGFFVVLIVLFGIWTYFNLYR